MLKNERAVVLVVMVILMVVTMTILLTHKENIENLSGETIAKESNSIESIKKALMSEMSEISEAEIDFIKTDIGSDNIEGFRIIKNDTEYEEVIVTYNNQKEEAEKVFEIILNHLKDIKENEIEKYDKDTFSSSNVCLKRVHIENGFYTYFIVSKKLETIEQTITSKMQS